MHQGVLLADRYRLEEPIGAGGMGRVWRATDLRLGRPVAAKQARVAGSDQLRREARITVGLRHRNIVTLYDVVTDGPGDWLVMEYVPSRSLATLLLATRTLHPREAAHLGAQVAAALAAAHASGVLHRDVTPGNVLVTVDGTAKLSDFGVAGWQESAATGVVVGAPAFIAPEVLNRRVGAPPSDVFSLGATLFRAVEGASPFGTGTQDAVLRRAARCEISPLRRAGPLAPVLVRLLDRNPHERPTAEQAEQLLQDVAGDQSRDRRNLRPMNPPG